MNGRTRWRQAEDKALRVLTIEGFKDPVCLKHFKHNFYFDVTAIREDLKICVFQVTTRTHTFVKRNLAYARELGLEFYVLYIRPRLTGYVLKHAEGPGAYALSLTDINRIKRI